MKQSKKTIIFFVLLVAMTLGIFTPIQAVSAQTPFMYDPSGYIYDASTGDEKTGKRIENALVTLEEWDDNQWVAWDGPITLQQNPQRSNENGEYAFFVSPGEYRVKVIANGYQDYSSDVDHPGAYSRFIEVPPPRLDVYIGMVPIGYTGSINVGGAGSGTSTNTGSTTTQDPINQDSIPQEPVIQEPVYQEPVYQEPGTQIPVVLEPVVEPEEFAGFFYDVNDSDWFYASVMYAIANDLFRGTSATLFSPDLAMTRGMLVTVLGRYHKIDAAEYTVNNFADVNSSLYYAPYIEWARANDIVMGVGDNTFAPDQIISRQDLAVMVIRYMNYANIVPMTASYITYADSDQIASYADNPVQQMVNTGIMNGKPNNCFDPRGEATRAEVATVLHRFAEKVRLASS